jgi:DNA-binding response OmpR family regulator
MVRILLRETHPDVIDVFRELVTHEGHTVCTATTIRDAERTLKGEAIDLLLTDLHAHDGKVLPWRAARRPELEARGTRTVIQTGVADRDLLRSRDQVGLTWLVRPYGLEELMTLVDRQTIR